MPTPDDRRVAALLVLFAAIVWTGLHACTREAPELAVLPEPGPGGPAPERKCDIVMKGGITSGIVYPRAVAALAKEYRFVNVGGASAGAIAAGATAACEYARTKGRD